MPSLPVYLDNHATTRVDPRVVEALLPFLLEHYGNAASVGHRFGWVASDALEAARAHVAALIGAEPRELVFTSGATEANNLAFKGFAAATRGRPRHVVTAATEHRAVLAPLKRLAREADNFHLTIVAPDPRGLISPESIETALTPETALVSIMAANNEIGTINPIAAIGRLCRDRGILCHVDATQAVGHIPVDVAAWQVDLLSLSGHKFHAPKGIGALFVRRGNPAARLAPLFDGGGQEHGLRGGTVPVPLAVGLGAASEIARRELPEEAARVARQRDALRDGFFSSLDSLSLNGHPTDRLPGNLHVSFAEIDGQALMLGLRDVAVSAGAACGGADPAPSHVLSAIGLDETLARASLRFGVGRFTTDEEIAFAVDYVASVVRRLRSSRV